MHFKNLDRREYPRYRTSLAAELVTPDATISCSLIDVSPAGASLSCWPLADDAAVTLRLSGFGDLKISRLRSNGPVERLVFRDNELRTLQWMKFLIALVDSGGAMAAEQRLAVITATPLLGVASQAPHDELAAHVEQALNLAVQISALGGHMPNNVVLFPAKPRKAGRLPPPDQPA